MSAYEDDELTQHIQARRRALRSQAMSGAERIAKERQRQLDVEGWDAVHDRGHGEELARAAAAYAVPEVAASLWPWDAQWYKPGDRIRELEKAGALIAAAIDSLLATPAPTTEEPDRP